MDKGNTLRGGAYRQARRLIPALALFGVLLAWCACAPEPGTPEARTQMAAEEIRLLIEQGAYDEAMAATRDSGELTDAERAELERMYAYHLGADAAAAGDDAAAYGHYEKAGDYLDAAEQMTRCFVRMEISRARTLFDACDVQGAFAALDALGGAAEAVAARQAWETEKPEKLMLLHERTRDTLGAGAWYTAALGAELLFAGDARYDTAGLEQEADAVYAGVIGMLYRKDGKLTAYGDGFGKKAQIESLSGVTDAAVGVSHVIAALDDGTARVLGSVTNGRALVTEWTDIAAVAAGAFHSVGLTGTGVCLAAGDNTYGQCDVTGWSGVTRIAAGLYHTVGLRADGTCVATGDNTYGQCDVSGWTDVLAVYCGANHTVALKTDFTLVAAGNNAAGQCGVDAWTDIVAVACGAWHTVGVRADGRFVVCGADTNGQAAVADWRMFGGFAEDPAPVPAAADGTADEIVYWGEKVFGPWLYLYQTGAVTVAFDESMDNTLLRADMYAAAGSAPFGVVCRNHVPVPAARLARERKLVFGLTGDYLDMFINQGGIKIREGKVYVDRQTITSIRFDDKGQIVFVESAETNAETLLAAGVKDCWSFGPVLMTDGAAADVSTSYFNTYLALRCVIGTMEPYHNIAVASGFAGKDWYFLTDIQELLLEYGVKDAYNMDGGNSTAFVFMGEMLNRSSRCVNFNRRGIRPLGDLIGFLQSDAVPSPDEPYWRDNIVVER